MSVSPVLFEFIPHFFVILSSLILCIYVYFKYSFTYWKRKGAPYLKPKFPLGNNDCIGFESLSYGLETVEWYKEAKRRGLKFIGAWNWANPVLLVVDPECIKDVVLKDFNYFTDRDFFHNPKYDPKNESIFVAEGDNWRNLRHRLSPVFSSAKMKIMFHLVSKCSEPMIEAFEKYSKTGENVDIKEVCALFTTDVIGCVGFGLDARSFSSQEAKFRLIGRKLFESTIETKFHLTISRINLYVARALGLRVIPKSISDFFTEVISKNVKFRQENNVVKSDLMDLLNNLYESSKGQEDAFTFEDFVGNVIAFFIAGFDTSATTMHFALFELAMHPEIQQRTREEIKRVLNNHGGDLTYEGVQEMSYLRQVIDETLRKYPPVQNVARFCVKPYTFKNSNVTVDKGISVVIPLVAIGRDPEIYPDPDRFDPDRFTAQNKEARNKFTYIPFGEGPRNCIGKRFGLMQTSIGLIQVLKDYKVSVSTETKLPLKLKHGVFLMQPLEKISLNISKLT